MTKVHTAVVDMFIKLRFQLHSTVSQPEFIQSRPLYHSILWPDNRGWHQQFRHHMCSTIGTDYLSLVRTLIRQHAAIPLGLYRTVLHQGAPTSFVYVNPQRDSTIKQGDCVYVIADKDFQLWGRRQWSFKRAHKTRMWPIKHHFQIFLFYLQNFFISYFLKKKA